MICPNCQNTCGDGDLFCFRCGTALTESSAPKKGTHRVPIAILILLSVLGIVLFFAIPITPVENDTPWFTVDRGVLYFDKALYSGGSEVTVPAVVNGQPVTELAEGCFENCTEITTVILPDSLLSIRRNAFSGCTSMRGVFIPEGVLCISPGAFSNCSALEAIGLPSTVESIGEGAFDGCKKLSFIFFNGEFSRWQSLYSEHISIKTQVYCSDGTHLHR